MAESARAVLEVVAGLIPGQPIEEFTRRWAITSAEWEEAKTDDANEMLADRNGRAIAYASLLMLRPNLVNWVRMEWVWL